MKTEQQLKDQCTPEFIKWMCELAEGFEIKKYEDYNSLEFGTISVELSAEELFMTQTILPLLIHRAVEGLNKLWRSSSLYKKLETALYCVKFIGLGRETVEYKFDDYKLQSLTQAECAMLHCLLDIFKEEE